MNSDSKEVVELSEGWVRCRSKTNSGRNYYFNRKTGKSSWTQPQPARKEEKKCNRKEVSKQIQEKRHQQEIKSKTVKRKSDEIATAGSTKKKQKSETPKKSIKKDRIKPGGYNRKLGETKVKPSHKIETLNKCIKSPSKHISPNKASHNLSATKTQDSPSKVTPPKNLACNRLSQLRAQLNLEAKNEVVHTPSAKKVKITPRASQHETPVRQFSALNSCNINESIGSTTSKSPSSDSLHSISSTSQFLAANKIISSMKAQLLEEHSNKEKPKDTFADIEQGICTQMTDYPVIKHPSTPPQFSEASKLVSAIKSKLAYTPKDVKSFASAKDRMEVLRASISGEVDESDLRDVSLHNSATLCVHDSVICLAAQTQKYEAMEVEDIKESSEISQPSFQTKDKDPYNGQIVLVVDTNIFIHELDFIKNVLNSHIKGYTEQPMLLVPWRVINELDRLKDNNNGNGAICKRARAAMDYLYKSLPENNRIKGQSLRDANSHIYPCELPDDEILNCALQQAERGRNVLLLSNDRNLCNKASINGIKRLGIAELKQLVEHHPHPHTDPELVAHFRHYEHSIYQLLANILENEMRAKYNNLWLHVLFKAPPWKLADVLQCLLKHWFAVFNEVFPRIEHLITDLKNTHSQIESKDPMALHESEVGNFKELCLDVARKCQIIPEYMELAKLTVDRLERSASETDDERARQTVVGAFEALWVIMSSYCAKLATALGVTHGVEDKIPADETLPTLSGKFSVFNTSIINFVLTIKGVLRIEDTSSMDDKINRLEAAFRECLQLTSHESRPTREELRGFCVTNRNMLQEAMNKFTELAQLLEVCKGRLAVLD